MRSGIVFALLAAVPSAAVSGIAAALVTGRLWVGAVTYVVVGALVVVLAAVWAGYREEIRARREAARAAAAETEDGAYKT